MTDTERIMSQLDEWVKTHGNGRYADPMAPDVVTPIQGVRTEVEELVELLCSLDPRHSCLDIGLGDFGGSHVLFRMLFEFVTTIENDFDKVSRFNGGLDYGGGHLPHAISPGCQFLTYDSHNPECMRNAQQTAPYDFLHIDGDHTYQGVAADYRNYSPMVRSGGIIAIHDLLQPGVREFVDDLEAGAVDATEHETQTILYSTHVGYALEVKR